MNHTTNYQLNQWELHDRVMMQDFNSDNAKIDAAIKAVADSKAAASALTALTSRVTALENKSRFTKLKEFVSTESSSFLQIYLSDINWAQWDKVHVDILAKQGGTYYFYNTNAASGGNSIGSISCPYIEGYWAPRMTFHVGFHADRMMDVSCGTERHVLSISYAQVVKMVFSGAVMSAGAKYVFWGEK